MREKRSGRHRKHWRRLVEESDNGGLCFYCETRIGSTIDHITPLSFGGSDDIENLVLACPLCNGVASNKVFDDVYLKRSYIQGVIKRRYGKRIAECTDCLILFEYRVNSPSLFLCAECYDYHYGTREANKVKWRQWLNLLDTAGYCIEAHREIALRRKLSPKLKQNLLLKALTDRW